MKATVLYFASIRDITGKGSETFELDDGAPLASLLDELVRRYPPVGEMMASTMVSVNQEYVEPDAALSDGDEVALIPPVSGG